MTHHQPAHEPIPCDVSCTLHATFQGSKLAPINLTLPFNGTNSYQIIEDTAREHVTNTCTEALVGRGLNFKYGNCTIIGASIEKDGVPLTTREDWDNVCTILTNYEASHARRIFQLEVYRVYLLSRSRAASDVSFAETKRAELRELMEKTSDNKKYIPRIALLRFTSPDNIREIIIEDTHLRMESEEKEEFIKTVQEKARCLLALCVFAGFKMECLNVLLANGCTDGTDPIEESHCCHKRCATAFDNLIEKQGAFKAVRFNTVGQHRNFDSKMVIPIQFKSVDDDAEEFVKQGRKGEQNDDLTYREKETLKAKACCGSVSSFFYISRYPCFKTKRIIIPYLHARFYDSFCMSDSGLFRVPTRTCIA